MNDDNNTDNWASEDLNSAWTGIQKRILHYSATFKASILIVYKKYFIFCYVDIWSCQKCGVLCSYPTHHILGIALFVTLPCQCIIKQMAQEMDMLTLLSQCVHILFILLHTKAVSSANDECGSIWWTQANLFIVFNCHTSIKK